MVFKFQMNVIDIYSKKSTEKLFGRWTSAQWVKLSVSIGFYFSSMAKPKTVQRPNPSNAVTKKTRALGLRIRMQNVSIYSYSLLVLGMCWIKKKYNFIIGSSTISVETRDYSTYLTFSLLSHFGIHFPFSQAARIFFAYVNN